MKRYIALLRGINISGKNKVPMAELKQGFEKLNYTEVKTYLVSAKKWAFKIAPGSPMSLLCIIEQDKLRFRGVDFAVP